MTINEWKLFCKKESATLYFGKIGNKLGFGKIGNNGTGIEKN
jgi:hypothetical protein